MNSMEYLFLSQNEKYDGSQIGPLNNYLKHGLLGDSIVGWVGACDVSIAHMLDGEDLRAKSLIKGDKMLHFIAEIFHQSLHAGVFFQRIFGEVLRQSLCHFGNREKAYELQRQGDDLYLDDGKLNVSIASHSGHSFLVHYGVNITNEGTPVKTACLGDFGVNDVEGFAKDVMNRIVNEVGSQKRATMKVRTLPYLNS